MITIKSTLHLPNLHENVLKYLADISETFQNMFL